MYSQSEQFLKNKYVLLKNFLHKDTCGFMVAELNRLIAEKKTGPDCQVPNSETTHGAFDYVLNELLPYFEKLSGKRLLPTYSFARMYAPGNELVNHIDRQSCEISATITLGFEGDVWPIYMGDDMEKSNAAEIKMEVGDAVMYRGMEKYHWREVYKEGKWQAQVFLHYVDADGPNAEWVFDKRGKLNLPESSSEVESFYRVFNDVLLPDACDHLVKLYGEKDVHREPPYIGGDINVLDKEIRNVERVMLDTYKDLGGCLAAVGLSANHFNWQFDITHANQAEFLIYPAGGRYKAHVDTFLSRSDDCRKLTVLAFLNDDFKGGKFFIQNSGEKHYPKQTKGTILVFPSFMLHGVEDVEEGVRYSAVCWMVGKSFK